MRHLLLLLFVVPFTVSAQQYDRMIDRAEALFQQKSYPAALDTFKLALADTIHAGRFDLYYGAKTAMYCNAPSFALRWLTRAAEKGLGSGDGEIAAVRSDSSSNRTTAHHYPVLTWRHGRSRQFRLPEP